MLNKRLNIKVFFNSKIPTNIEHKTTKILYFKVRVFLKFLDSLFCYLFILDYVIFFLGYFFLFICHEVLNVRMDTLKPASYFNFIFSYRYLLLLLFHLLLFFYYRLSISNPFYYCRSIVILFNLFCWCSLDVSELYTLIRLPCIVYYQSLLFISFNLFIFCCILSLLYSLF